MILASILGRTSHGLGPVFVILGSRYQRAVVRGLA
jgi:hypothetical protein